MLAETVHVLDAGGQRGALEEIELVVVAVEDDVTARHDAVENLRLRRRRSP